MSQLLLFLFIEGFPKLVLSLQIISGIINNIRSQYAGIIFTNHIRSQYAGIKIISGHNMRVLQIILGHNMLVLSV